MTIQSIINQRSIVKNLTYYDRQDLIWNCDCSSTEKLVLMALNHHADENGECSPTKQSLEQKCNITRIGRVTDRLMEKNLIIKTTRFADDNAQLSNQYQILFDALKPEKAA